MASEWDSQESPLFAWLVEQMALLPLWTSPITVSFDTNNDQKRAYQPRDWAQLNFKKYSTYQSHFLVDLDYFDRLTNYLYNVREKLCIFFERLRS